MTWGSRIPEGRKVGSLKRRLRSHLWRWELNNCMQLWHEAPFKVKVKMYKAPQPQPDSNFFRMRESEKRYVEQVHAVVMRSKFRSTKHLSPRALLEVEMWKKCRPLWHKAHFEVEMSKKCRPMWRSPPFQSKKFSQFKISIIVLKTDSLGPMFSSGPGDQI